MRALRDRPTALERWPKGVHDGIKLATGYADRTADAFYQKRVPKGAPPYVESAAVTFPSGRTADEVCPTEIAVPAWAAQMGTHHLPPVAGPARRHRPPRRAAHRPRPAAGHRLRGRRPGRAGRPRPARRARHDGLPQDRRATGACTSTCGSSRGGTFVDVRHAAIAFGRELSSSATRRRHHRLVEGGARRADLRRLQPELARPHHRLGVQPAAPARRSGVDPGDTGTSWPRSRPAGVQPRHGAGPAARPRRPARRHRRRTRARWSRCWTCSTEQGSVEATALPAGLPEDAGRAAAGAAEQEGRRALGRARQPRRVTAELSERGRA